MVLVGRGGKGTIFGTWDKQAVVRCHHCRLLSGINQEGMFRGGSQLNGVQKNLGGAQSSATAPVTASEPHSSFSVYRLNGGQTCIFEPRSIDIKSWQIKLYYINVYILYILNSKGYIICFYLLNFTNF